MESRGRRERRHIARHTDTWVLWNLTGGPRGCACHRCNQRQPDHVDESRDAGLGRRAVVSLFSIPRVCCPNRIVGAVRPAVSRWRPGLSAVVPITGILGDQHAAMVGQTVWPQGGEKHLWDGLIFCCRTVKRSCDPNNGLLTTVCYQIRNAKPCVRAEGSSRGDRLGRCSGYAISWASSAEAAHEKRTKTRCA